MLVTCFLLLLVLAFHLVLWAVDEYRVIKDRVRARRYAKKRSS